MESLHKDPILRFNPDTLQEVRKECGIEKPGEMERAIDILELWIKKQEHFLKKDFSRGYLERSIIRAKGSVERTKERLDKLCTGRSTFPQYFGIFNVKDFVDVNDHLYIFICPKLTKDNHRVCMLHVYNTENLSSQLVIDFYKRSFYLLEYYCAYDYNNGGIFVFDYRFLNIMEFISVLDILEAARLLNVLLNGYGMRIKQIHVVSPSKLINLLISTFKQIISEKLASRIHVHSDIESVHQYIDKDILPEDCGGSELPMKVLHDNWADVLCSEEFMTYIKDIYGAKVNETLRPIKRQNDEMGLSGTFRSLNVD